MHIVISCCDLLLLLLQRRVKKRRGEYHLMHASPKGRKESKNQLIIECEIINRGKHQWIPPIVFFLFGWCRCDGLGERKMFFCANEICKQNSKCTQEKRNSFLYTKTTMLCSHHNRMLFFFNLRRNKTLASSFHHKHLDVSINLLKVTE